MLHKFIAEYSYTLLYTK